MLDLSPNDQVNLALFVALHVACLAAWVIGRRIADRRQAARAAEFERAMAKLDALDDAAE